MGKAKGGSKSDMISYLVIAGAVAEAQFRKADQAHPRPWSYFMATWAAVHDAATHYESVCYGEDLPEAGVIFAIFLSFHRQWPTYLVA